MAAFPVLCVAALIVAVRIGLREASRDDADLAGVMPRVRVHRGRPARPLARAARLAHAGFVALGVASLLVMLLALATALAR
jgi:hypothetical protein